MAGITFANPGNRNVKIDAEAARKLVRELEKKLEDGHHIETLKLECRSYKLEAVVIICDFLHGKLGKCTAAYHADVIANLMTDEGLECLAKWSKLFESAPIEYLDLSDNAFGSRGISACEHALSIPTLKHLKLHNMGIPHESIVELGPILTGTRTDGMCVASKLESFYFYNNMSGPGGARALGEILAETKNLKNFQLEGCRPGKEGTKAVMEGLVATDYSQMETLGVEGSFGTGEKEDDAIHELLTMLQNAPKLREVRFMDCGFGNDGLILVIKALRSNNYRNQLTKLEFEAGEMEISGLKKLLPLVRNNAQSLELLNLRGPNEFTSKGVEFLARSFQEIEGNIALKSLDLQECQIGNRGATALLRIQGRLTNLQSLILSENGFGEGVFSELKTTFGGVVELDEVEDGDEMEDFDEDYYVEDDDNDDGDSDDDDEDQHDADADQENDPVGAIVGDLQNLAVGTAEGLAALKEKKGRLTMDDVSL